MTDSGVRIQSRAVLLSLMFIAVSLTASIVSPQDPIEDDGDVDPQSSLPLFQLLIGDEWLYDTSLDAQAMIDPDDPAWFGTDIPQPLTGETLRIVENITIVEHLGRNETVYVIESTGRYSGSGTFPAPVLGLVNGVVDVRFERTEWVRLSDLALLQQVTGLYIDLDHLAGTELLTDIVNTWSFEPEAEYYDFPSKLHEEWSSAYLRNESWTGDKGYFSVDNKMRNVERAFNLTEFGQPPIAWTNCEQAYNISQTNSEGEQTEYRWVCPEVRGALVEWYDDIIFGAPAMLELKSFTAGTEQTSSIEVLIDKSNDLTNMTLGSPILFTIWVNNSAGEPLVGELVRVNYLNRTSNHTTDEYGSISLNISAGVSKDSTPTIYDWGSHGLVISHPDTQSHLAFTVILNSSAIAEGIALRASGMQLIDHWVSGSFTLATQFGDQIRW